MPIKVLYAADCEMQVITVHKGLDNYTFSEWIDDSTWLQDVFAAAGDIEWRHVKIYDVMPEFPTTLEEMRAFDVIILSDVGVNSLQLLPTLPSAPRGAHGREPPGQPASVRRGGRRPPDVRRLLLVLRLQRPRRLLRDRRWRPSCRSSASGASTTASR